MKNILIAIAILMGLTACGKHSSSPLAGTYQVMSVICNSHQIGDNSILSVGGDGATTEGSCTANMNLDGNGHLTLTSAVLTDSSTCPFIANMSTQDVNAYSFQGSKLIVDSNSNNGNNCQTFAELQ